MRPLIKAFLRHDRAVIMILLAIFLFGVMNYAALPKEENPDVQIPLLYIPVFLQGISPQDSEKMIIKPLERKLKSISGIDEMTGIAYEGGGYIKLKFESDVNIKQVINEVRAKIDEARPEMPDNIDEIVVHEINFSDFPVLNIILQGNAGERDFVRAARDLKDKIETIPEVLKVEKTGLREEVVEITIKPSALEIYHLDISEVERIVSLNNFLIQAGSLKTTDAQFSLKVSGMFETTQDIENLPIKVDGQKLLLLKDIATVKETFKDYENIARVNGEKAVVLEISKRAGKNIIETIETVRQVVEKEKAFLPNNIKIIYSQDNSTKIKDMLDELVSSIIIAVAIVFAIIVYELGTRSALLVSVAIPGSFFVGIIIITLMNLTINVVVLFGLILAIGILVDAAIVVVEYADRKMIGGMKPGEAYLNSATDMFWPSVAASLTTKIVFLPLLFWPGTVGEFMKYLPLTLLSTLIGSLFMALMFIPVLGTYFGRPKKLSLEQIEKIEAIEEGKVENLSGIVKTYAITLNNALKRPWLVLGTISGILITVIILFKFFGRGSEFFPKIEPNNATIDIHARGNLSIYQKDDILKEIEKLILPKFSSEVRVFYTKVGKVNERLVNSDIIGSISLEFAPWKKRRKAEVILNEMRSIISNEISGVTVTIQKEQKGPGSTSDIELEIVGRDDQLLLESVDKVLDYMKKIGGFVDIDDSKPLPMIDFELVIDRQKAALNKINIASLNALIPLMSEGVEVSKFRGGDYDEEIDIIVRFQTEYRNLTQLQNLHIYSNGAGMVPLSNFATFRPIQKLASIEHSNSSKVRTVKANVSPGLVANNQLQAILKMAAEDPNWSEKALLIPKGDSKDMKKTSSFLLKAFIGAITGMIITLVLQFNSVIMALIILSAVFFSVTGVLIALMITMQPFGVVMCGVAIITLAGIVVNNNILLIDAYLKLVAEGVDRLVAVQRAAISRLRPIILTSLTTAIGLLPMVLTLNINLVDFEFGFGAPSSQWWVQLSTSIVGGVLFATVLTLFFTPSVLTIYSVYIQNKDKKRAEAEMLNGGNKEEDRLLE